MYLKTVNLPETVEYFCLTLTNLNLPELKLKKRNVINYRGSTSNFVILCIKKHWIFTLAILFFCVNFGGNRKSSNKFTSKIMVKIKVFFKLDQLSSIITENWIIALWNIILTTMLWIEKDWKEDKKLTQNLVSFFCYIPSEWGFCY